MTTKPLELKFSKRFVLWLSLVLTAIVAITLLSIRVWDYGRNQYYWGVSDSVQSLLDDPIVSATFDGLKLVDVKTNDHISFTGKARPAFVYLWYDVSGTSPEDAVERVAAGAKANGWSEVEDLSTRDEVWVGRKNESKQTRGRTIIITSDVPRDPDRPPNSELVVRLVPS